MKTALAVIALILIGAGAYLLLVKHPAGPFSSGTEATSSASGPVTFYCGDGNAMQATFATSTVDLVLSDGRGLSLVQARSGSGFRYEAASIAGFFTLIGKRDSASLTNSASSTDTRYASCVAANVEQSDAPGYNTYADRSNTFNFAFPSNLQVVGFDPSYTTDWSTPASTNGLVLAKLYLSQSAQPGTNFANAWFTVGVSADPTAVKNCTKLLSGEQATTTVAIGDTQFTGLEFKGAAAGNRYDTTSYRTVRDNECYAIEYTIHYNVLENYPEGTVKAFDEKAISSMFDEVVRTFRFTK